MPLFGASKMIPSGPGWTNYRTRRSFDKNVNHICCAAFLKPVSFQAHSQHHKGSIYHCCGCLGDMWRARVLFWGAPLQDADQLRVFLSTGNSRDFSDHNGQLSSVHATPAKETGILIARVLYWVQYSAFSVHYLHAAKHHRRSKGPVQDFLQFVV